MVVFEDYEEEPVSSESFTGYCTTDHLFHVSVVRGDGPNGSYGFYGGRQSIDYEAYVAAGGTVLRKGRWRDYGELTGYWSAKWVRALADRGP